MSKPRFAFVAWIAVVKCLMLVALTTARAEEGKVVSNEEKIRHALAQPTSFDFVETPLEDAIKYVKEKHEIEIQFDKRALDEAGITVDTPVIKDVRGVSLRSALDLLLRDLNLTYVIKDEVLLITTPDKRFVTKVYDIHDLTPDAGYEKFVQDLMNHMGPNKWDGGGGAGSMSLFTSNGVAALIVTQSSSVQDDLEALLADLRRLRKASKDK